MRRSHNRRRSPYDISRAVVLLVILALAALLVFGAVRLLTLSTAPTPTPTPQPSAAPSAGEPEETAAQEEAPGESEGGSLYLDIAVDVENRTLQVSQQVQWVNDTGSEQEEIVFRMYPNALNNGEDTPLAEELAQEAFPNGAQTEGIVVRGAAVDGRAAEFSVDGALRTTLRVRPAAAVPEGGEVSVTLLYTLALPQGDYPLGYSSSGLQACWFYPVRALWEDGGWHLTDVVENGGFPWYYPASQVYAAIRLPQGVTMCSTGSVQTTAQTEEGVIYYVSAAGARDFAFCLTELESRYERTEGGVEFLALSQSSRYSRLAGDTAAGMAAFLTEFFGSCPIEELELVQAELAMEVSVHSGLVLFDRDFLRNQSESLPAAAAAATAWQWFGGAVGGGYADDRDLHAPLCDYLAARYLQQDAEEGAETDGWISEGAEKIEAIRAYVGEERFDEALKEYYRQYAGKKGGAEAFAALCGEEYEAEVFARLRGYGVP